MISTTQKPAKFHGAHLIGRRYFRLVERLHLRTLPQCLVDFTIINAQCTATS